MTQDNAFAGCTKTCRIIAGLIGLVVFLYLLIAADWRFLTALILGIIIGVICAFVFPKLFCSESAAAQSAGGTGAGTTSSAANASSATSSAASASADVSTSSASSASTAPTSAAAVQPSSLLAGEADLAEKKGDWKYDAEAKSAKKPATKKTTAKKPAAKKPAAKKAASKTAAKAAAKPAAKPAGKAKAPAVAKDGKPPLLKKARAGGADDLKLIKGVGPGLEKTLNELGFYHFDQISAWRKKEVEWVDSRLKFKGRIVRDDWIKQAKALAKGGS